MQKVVDIHLLIVYNMHNKADVLKGLNNMVNSNIQSQYEFLTLVQLITHHYGVMMSNNHIEALNSMSDEDRDKLINSNSRDHFKFLLDWFTNDYIRNSD